MRRHLALSTVALCAMIGAAWAQTPPPGTPPTPAQPDAAAPADTTQSRPPAADPAKPQTAQAGAVRFVTPAPGDVLITDLIGLTVYNNKNEDIGDIVDMYIADGKTVRALIVEVGGFLGIGERYVSVDPSSIVITRKGDEWRAVMNTTSEELKGAPTVDYEALSDD